MSGLGQAKQDQQAAEQKRAKPVAASEKPEVAGKAEGLQVHGHGVVEVRNRDGSLTSPEEFENSPASGGNGGAALSAPLTTEAYTVRPWQVAAGPHLTSQTAASGN